MGLEQFLGALQRFGIGRLAAVVGIVGGAIAAVLALAFNVGAEPKALLYSNLDLKEASSITQALDQAGIKHEEKGDGSIIMVPRDKVASARLMLSGKGLPTSGSVGYEIFDQSSGFGQTDFVQNLNKQRALEGELARTIRSLEGINAARVALVLPKRQLFEEEAEAPSASVVIGYVGRQPTGDQVRAMQNLVAAAVPNLKPEKVTIVDQNSHLLAGGDADGIMGQAGEERRAQAEEGIRRKVKELVEGVVGPGKVRVNVTADLDLAQVTTQERNFNPDGQVVRSEQTVEENSKENQPQNSGQVSAANNIPGSAPTPGQIPLNSSTSGSNQSTTNYEISETTKTTAQAPGAIKRISVAVAVDGITPVDAKGKAGAWQPRSDAEMQKIQELVQAAVGYDTERGDKVTVTNVRFNRDQAVEGGVKASSPLAGFDKNDIMRLGELGVLGVMAVLLIFFVVRPMLKGGGAGPTVAPMALAGGGHTVQGMPAGFLPTASQIAADPGLAGSLPAPDTDARIDIAKIEGQVKASSVKQVSDFVDKHPEESVSILRSWLHETA